MLPRRLRPPPRPRYRVLYVGRSFELIKALRERLKDLPCLSSRCPADATWLAHAFIRSDNRYYVFLFDEVLTEMSGEELAAFALAHRARTPTIVVSESDDVECLVESVRRLLCEGGV